MHSASEQFDEQLRKAVLRLSDGNFSQEIREVAEHYLDIYQESLSYSADEKWARKEASRRIGVMGDIARKIVDSPQRIKSGMRLQRTGIILWVLAPFLSFGISLIMRSVSPVMEPYFAQLASGANNLMLIGGAVTAVGAFKARRINAKSMILGSSGYFVFSILCFIAVRSNPFPTPFLYFVLSMAMYCYLPFLTGFAISFGMLRVAVYR